MRRRIGVNRVEKKENYWLNLFKTQASEFCLATGLHGYKYIAQTERSKIERIVWFIIVLTSVICAVTLMTIAWNYNSVRRTITVIETTHRGIWNYPFPAVTACNLNRVSLKRARNLVRQLKYPKNLTADFLISEMRLLLELGYPGIHEYDVKKNLTRLQDIFDANEWTISQVMEEVTQNCSELLLGCKWKGSLIDCREIFETSISRDGRCCSFNYITSMDPRIPPKSQSKTLPSCGYQTGLTLYLNTDPDDYLATFMGAYGAKIMLHYPYNYPDDNAQEKLVSLGTQIFISVSPEEIYSTAEVRELPIKTRECIFSDEENIDRNADIKDFNFTYAKYTYQNCLTRCRASTIKKYCHCIPYYYPQKGTKICDLKDVPCLSNHSAKWETSWPGIYVDPKLFVHDIPTIKKSRKFIKTRPCGCLPDCGMYRYPVESSKSSISGASTPEDLTFIKNTILRNESVVHVFFSDLMSIQYRRSVSYKWLNLLASFGGLLGLFVGFSIMSAYELVYFFVIRVIGDAWMKRKNNSSLETLASDGFDKKMNKRRRF